MTEEEILLFLESLTNEELRWRWDYMKDTMDLAGLIDLLAS